MTFCLSILALKPKVGPGGSIHTFYIHFSHLWISLYTIHEGFNSLIEVDTHYQLDEPRIAHYTQLLNEQGDTARRGWRYRIARWMLRVADEFCLRRDTALVALNLFDRNMSASLHNVDRDEFQLSAITCIFLSSKLYQKRPLKLSSVSWIVSSKLLLLPPRRLHFSFSHITSFCCPDCFSYYATPTMLSKRNVFCPWRRECCKRTSLFSTHQPVVHLYHFCWTDCQIQLSLQLHKWSKVVNSWLSWLHVIFSLLPIELQRLLLLQLLWHWRHRHRHRHKAQSHQYRWICLQRQ